MSPFGDHPELLPFQRAAENPYTRVHASHLLGRAGFGATPGVVDRVMRLGPEAAVDELLNFPDAEVSEAEGPDLSPLINYPSDFVTLSKRFTGVGERDARILRGKMIDAHRAVLLQVQAWWLARMAYGPHPLQEKLTLFWHGHFTTSSYDLWSTRMLWAQNQLERRHAAGNFGDLLAGICHDPAMLQYLDNATSHRDAPNENFARELLELYSVGIGQYSEEDIRAIARAFSGWSHDGERFVFRRDAHDFDEKKIFNQAGHFDGNDVVALVLKRDACPAFIATRLFQYFVRAQVSQDLSTALGQVFREMNLEIRPLVRLILCSRAFYEPDSIGTQVKSPVQLMAGTVRTLNIAMPEIHQVKERLAAMGQIPFLPPDVKGWPSGRASINTTTLFARQNAAVWLASMASVQPSDLAWDRQVDQWLDRLIPAGVGPEKRAALVDLGREGSDVSGLVQLIVSLPEFQLV
jgi:uncharacterized protein (DUF1800 family)